MPVFRDIPITLNKKEILHRQGMGACTSLRPEIVALSHSLLASIAELQLLESNIAYEAYPITEACHDRLFIDNGIALHGSLLTVKFPSASKLAAIVCTIGPKLEKAVSSYFNKGEPLRGLLLDGIGNAALDSLVREACRLVRKEASLQGYQISSPINPGMPGLPVSEQRTLFKLAPAGQIGIHLSSSGVMTPRKSISMVIGMGIDMPAWTWNETCVSCNMARTCRYSSSFKNKHVTVSN